MTTATRQTLVNAQSAEGGHYSFGRNTLGTVTVLGERKKLKLVMKGGRSVDLETPDPVCKPIPGWRVNTYGKILSRAPI